MKHLFSILFLFFCLPMITWAQDYTTESDTIAEPNTITESDTITEPEKNLSIRHTPDGYYFSLQIIEMKVHRDRTMDVTEMLRANFLEESHGLFRAIPKRFWTKRDVSEEQDGSDYEMRYNAVDIDDLDVSENFRPEENDSMLVIRIGSADVLIKGLHTYKITYKLTIPNDDRVDASDLFFHSIIGSGWNCPTDTVFFKVEFDDEIPAASLDSLKILCGPEGKEDNRADQVLLRKESNLLKGYYFGLKELEAITVYLPLPDGYFEKGKIPFWCTIAWIFAAITLLLALYLLFQEIKGDEPVTPVVTFRPSKGLTSADIGSLVDAKIDDIDLLSVIPWMAAEGYIVMNKLKNGKTKITRGDKELPAGTPEYIKCIYDGFFLKKEEFFLDSPGRTFGEKWNKARRLLSKKYAIGLVDDTFTTPLVLMIFCFALTCSFATVSPDKITPFFSVGMMLTFEYIFYRKWKSMIKKIKFKDGCLNGCVSLLIIHFLFMAILTGTGTYFASILISKDYYLGNWTLLSIGTIVAIAIMFNLRLHRITPLRRKHLGEILGLKEFILTAEKDRLEMLLKEDERYFYRILPYAMVFGLVDKWAAKFDALTVQPINEFGGTAISNISSLLDTQDMKRFASRSSAAAIPTSSGSGGSGSWSSHSSSGGSYHSASSHSGGYSGGGSGGGGGGRW